MFLSAAVRTFSSSSSVTTTSSPAPVPPAPSPPRARGSWRTPARASGRLVVAEGREAAIVGGAELVQGYESRGFEHAVANDLGALEARVDGRDHADEGAMSGLEIRGDDRQRAFAVAFAGERKIEVAAR